MILGGLQVHVSPHGVHAMVDKRPTSFLECTVEEGDRQGEG